MDERTCERCGIDIGERHGRAKFCSRRCSSASQRERSGKLCATDGCDRPVLARGICSSHYASWHREQHGRKRTTYQRTCVECGSAWETTRPEARFCTAACKGKEYARTKRRTSRLPASHPVMEAIAAAKRAEVEARRLADRQSRVRPYSWQTPRECPGCACWFTPLHTPNAVMCSRRCQRRVHRWRRKAAERGAPGSFKWSEFMQIARKFGYRCAYCGIKPERLDPDHVVPLSRGGSNAPSNLLPSCPDCNTSKGAMTLPEWESWRMAKRMMPRATRWDPADVRYTHLTDALLVARAARAA